MTDDKELKDQRIPIMMTASELKAIDDWSFENRIRSRGEAIRRLCQIGIMFDENRMDLMRMFAKVAEPVSDLPKILEKHSVNIDDPKSLSDLDRDLLRTILSFTTAILTMLPDMRTVVGIVKNYKSEGDLNEIMREAKEIFEIKVPELDEWQNALKPGDES